MPSPRICLSMIVRNESQTLPRSLASFLPHIHSAVILDTGSTDNTVPLLHKLLGEKGDFHFLVTGAPFEDFSQARNTALQSALAAVPALIPPFDYLLHVDADMTCQGSLSSIHWPDEAPNLAYSLPIHHAQLRYSQPRLLHRHTTPKVKYRGRTHEHLDLAGIQALPLNGFNLVEHGDGGTRPEKFDRDCRLLEKDLADNPGDPRTTFYLANTFFDMNRHWDAITLYTKRLSQGGWEEEIYFSLLRLGLCHWAQRDYEKAQAWLLSCWNHSPHRAEPLRLLANLSATLSLLHLQKHFTSVAQKLPLPSPSDNRLFVDTTAYRSTP